MKRFVINILISCLCISLLSSCTSSGENIKVISAKPSGYEINLYTHQDDEEQANEYMSALLNWKTNQEEEEYLSFQESTVHTSDIDITSDQLPALIIYKDGKPIQTVTGKNTSPTDIIDTLENTVAITNNQNS
ncbi:hypothetical protein [Halobacillus sp. A5]|uniref:hypothetical protein n=1 Tax=Halobacillus sp. A5 TaxID=2880263 RepID=UPI0020A6280A|nr:hypothetical protein [Halobacillus sp. A5]MCP3026266.1 hypothetical protein [Halobacillus sp. A5]